MRRTRPRRRFHTDRIVLARRARYLRVVGCGPDRLDPAIRRRLSHGALANTTPWDCGTAACGICRDPTTAGQRRRRAERSWRDDWGMERW
ncbi:hypothetical protein [Paraconexibacter algicola]|uniref:hypothetical protein n=1 Tax=Paraconexibacter algicola TaxID=2133960 RepID=UPI000D1E6D97|nr:hypothetical protein [Paraconexibacter algicola]